MKKRPKKNVNLTEQDVVSIKRHQRRLRAFKERRRINKAKITLIRLRSLSRVIAVLILGWVVFKIAFLPQWYFNKDIFKSYPSPYLAIEGNEIITADKIVASLSKIRVHKVPLYLFSTSEVEKSILKLTPAKKVYVRRFWSPARLKIVVEEKKPILAITPSPKAPPVAVFTEDGTIIGKEYLPLPARDKVYTLLTFDDFTQWKKTHVDYMIFFSKMLEQASGEKVMFIDIRNPNDVYVQLQSCKLRMGDMNRTIFKRAKRVSYLIPRIHSFNNTVEYLDLRWEKTIFIKLKSKEQQKADVESVKNKLKVEAEQKVKQVKEKKAAKPDKKKKV